MSWVKGKAMAPKTERPTELAKRITDLRMEMGLTQRELAEAIHCNRVTIHYYESGLNTPKGERLMAMADVFQTTADYLITGDGARWKSNITLPWKKRQDLRGRIYCPYCGRGQGWSVRDIEINGYDLSDVRFCNFCGRRTLC